MKLFILIMSAMFLILLIVGTQGYSQEQTQPKNNVSVVRSEKAKTIYTCPMHPKVTSPKPGACPECGMNLVKKQLDKEQQKNESKIEVKPEQSNTQSEEKTGAMMVTDAPTIPVAAANSVAVKIVAR